MGKLIRRVNNDSLWEVDECEAWFKDMSSKGYHLKSCGNNIFTFEEGNKADYSYRVIFSKEEISEDVLTEYKARGWDLLLEYRHFRVFVNKLEKEYMELCEDFSKVRVRQYDKAIIHYLWGLVVFAVIAFYISDEKLLVWLAQDKANVFLVVISIGIMSIILNLKRCANAYKRKKSLLTNGQSPKNFDISNWRLKNSISWVLSWAFLIAIIVLAPFSEDIFTGKVHTITEKDNSLPVVRLYEIERNPELKIDVNVNSDGYDERNYVRRWKTLFSPIIYRAEENAYLGKERIGVDTTYYSLRFESMAHGVLKDMLSHRMYGRYVKHSPVKSEYFDEIYVVNSANFKSVFAAWGSNVIRITYFGDKKVEDIVRAMEENLVGR